MIFVSSQPDDTFFVWQLLTLYDNLKELGIPKEDIHCLIAYKDNTLNTEWDRYRDVIHATLHFIPDTRVSSNYLVSIRPHIIAKFLQNNPHFVNEYILYHDADIYFTDLPLFEGMEDGRIHVSRTDYLDWHYIRSKNSPSLMQDLLNIVGIDEQTIQMNQLNTGGAQVYAKGLSIDYWNKVERDCENLYNTYFLNVEKYKTEYDVAVPKININGIETSSFDFQYWTMEMWAMLWNQWLFGFKTYANPDLKFSWPYDNINDWDTYPIYHNSGLIKDKDNENNWFFKSDFTKTFPTKFNYPCQINFNNGFVQNGCQQNYLKVLETTAKKYWIESLKSYYGIVNIYFDLATLVNKFNQVAKVGEELIILNTTNEIVQSVQPNIIIINTNVCFNTGKVYENQDEQINDISKFASYELYSL